MIDWLFDYEQEKLPPVVVLTTAALIALFVLGLLYRAISFALF